MNGKIRKRIRKASIEVTVLYREDGLDKPSDMTLADILYEMENGSFIGGMRVMSDAPLEFDDVVDELLLLGNDGSFFDDSEFEG